MRRTTRWKRALPRAAVRLVAHLSYADDQLMSDTSMTKEFGIAVSQFGLNLKDLEKVTLNSMKSAFVNFDERLQLIYDVIKPGYQGVR